MRSCPVEVHRILIQNTLELFLLKDQQMVEAFLPHTSQEAFADGVGAFRLNRRFEQLDATDLRHSAETGSKLAIVITDQILGCLPIRRRFSQLLGHPGIRWASSHAHVDHLARLEFYDEERLRAVERKDLSPESPSQAKT